jgi:hypothetical protein
MVAIRWIVDSSLMTAMLVLLVGKTLLKKRSSRRLLNTAKARTAFGILGFDPHFMDAEPQHDFDEVQTSQTLMVSPFGKQCLRSFAFFDREHPDMFFCLGIEMGVSLDTDAALKICSHLPFLAIMALFRVWVRR